MANQFSGKVLRTGLALSLAAGMTPAMPAALAQETNAEAIASVADERAVEYTPIYEQDEIVAAFQTGGNYELRGSVTIDESLTIPEGVNVVLNLRGYSFDLGSNKINVSGSLTLVNESSGGYEGAVLGGSDVINILADGSVTVNGGCAVEASTGSAVKLAYRDNVSFELYGGRLTSPSTTVNAMKGTVNILFGSVETTSDKASVYAVGNQYGEAAIQVGLDDMPDSEVYVQSVQNPRDAQAPLIIKSGTIGRIAPAVNDMDQIGGRFENDLSGIMPQGYCCVPVEEDDGTYYRIAELSVETAGAQIGERYYASAIAAAREVQDGETLTILRDVEGASDEALLSIAARDVTVELNGHSITNTGSGYGIAVKNPYGGDMRECAATIQNSSSTRSTISASIPVSFESGDSRYTITGQVFGGVDLESTNATTPQAYNLGSGARIPYSPTVAEALGNGGFLADDGSGHSYIYGQFASALDVDADGTVQLLNNYVGSGFIASGEGEGVLDMNGYSFTTTGDKVVDVNYDGASLVIKNGALNSEHANADGIVMLNSESTLELDSVNINLSGDGFAIVTNGEETNNTILLKNSMVLNPNGAGIYFPSTGSVYIDNSYISAKYMGVQLCAGSLDIVSGTNVVVTGEPVQKTENDGPIYDGAAVSVVNRDGYQKLGKVSIKGGTFTSADGVDAVKAYAFNNADKTEGAWNEAAEVVDITGGEFSSSPAALMEQGYVAQDDDGTFTVIKKENLGAGTYETAPGDAITSEDIQEGLVATVDGETGQTIVGSETGIVEYHISCNDDGNGSVTTNVSKSAVDDTVTITVTPNDGYDLADLSVADANGNKINLQSNDDGTFSFVMPNSTVTVSATFKEAEQVVTEHTISVIDTLNGSVSTNVTKAEAGDTVTITATPSEGYEIGTVSAFQTGGLSVPVERNEDGTFSFTMPEGDVSVAVTFDKAQGEITEHAIAVSAGANGTVQTSASKAEEGATVTITAMPDEGYKVGAVAVTKEDGTSVDVEAHDDGTYTFAMPAENVTVTVSFEENAPAIVDYGVNVALALNGTTTTDMKRAEAGDVVTIATKPDEEYALAALAVFTNDGNRVEIIMGADGTATFIMPSEDVTVFASYQEAEAEQHDISLTMTSNGAAKTNVSKASEGERVTLEAVPADGYEVEAISVTSGGKAIALNYASDGTWWFTMPDGDVDIHVVFAEKAWHCDGQEDCPSYGFVDFDEGAWYHQAVDWAVSHKVMSGYDGTIVPVFGPDDELTRAQMAQILYNMAGQPIVETDGVTLFSDCDASAWYAPAVSWAVDEGLFEGYGDLGTFGPDDAFTREQAAVVLMRVAEKSGQDVAERDDLDAYPDAGSVSEWADEAMAWAVAEGIVRGVESEGEPTTLAPQGTATRAQAAALMMRLVDAGFLELHE